MANTTLDLVSLDFEAVKSSFKTFLRTQDLFKDYDFEGSDLNVLLDLLAINTQKNGFYLNMALSEAFIDSAQLRTSILSHAKELNYVPRSARSARANVAVTFTANGASAPYVIQKGQSFAAAIKSSNYTFTIPETLTVASANTTFTFTTDIFEGTFVKDTYIYDTLAVTKSFKITNQTVDLDSLIVNVYENGAVIADIYTRTTSLLDLDGSSKIFFVQTNAADGRYEVIFGDGVLGRAPVNGAVIVLDYRLSSGKPPNGASVFSINFDPTQPSGSVSELSGPVTILVNQAAQGGDTIEDIETTRFYAPRYFQTQERAVVPSDYSTLLLVRFPEIAAINVYGGENLTPPQFGKVVIAVDIANVTGLPLSKIDEYTSFLRPRMMLTEFPIFVAPEFTYLNIKTKVRYNINVTSETNSRIETLVRAALSDYNTDTLSNFNVRFLLSRVTRIIDDADPSIISNETEVELYKKVVPVNGTSQDIVMQFSQQLIDDLPPLDRSHNQNSEKVLRSTAFTFNGDLVTLEDDNNGLVRIVKLENNAYNTVIYVGRIDYNTGLVQLSDFKPDSFEGEALSVFVRPRSNDIKASLNTIMAIDHVDTTIVAERG